VPATSGRLLSDLCEIGAGISVHLDLRDVDVVTASTLGKLVVLHRNLRPLGGRIILRNVTPFVLEIFRATRLDMLFEIQQRPLLRLY
jgi:anti-anti-sigma factor